LIILAGTFDLDPAQREAALEAAIPLMEPVRVQPGCLDYVWSPDPAVPGRIYVFERWETQESLAKHLASQHYRDMRDTMPKYGLTAVDVSKYRIDLQEPVYDETATPRADFFTEGR
jgi:quinol monooxygenase YgiN